MSEMVERVSEAIYREFENRPRYAQAQMNVILAQELARAAIGAMDPTPEMIAAALPKTNRLHDTSSLRLAEKALFMLEHRRLSANEHANGLTAALDLIRDFRAMRDAALNEKAPSP